MAVKTISVDLADERIEQIAEIMGNKTCRKILAVIAEKEMSESEIAESLGIPLNTAGYNVKKLVSAGLLEKNKGFFWSVKGKKIERYSVSNKKIVISPRVGVKGVLPAVVVTGIIAVGIKLFQDLSNKYVATEGSSSASQELYATAPLASDAARSGMEFASASSGGNIVLWFLFGALAALIIVLAFNWRKIW